MQLQRPAPAEHPPLVEVTAPLTRNSEPSGSQKSTVGRCAVAAAKGTSRPQAKARARSVGKTTTGGTSATTTKTGRSTRGQSTAAATEELHEGPDAPPEEPVPALAFDLGAAGAHILSVFGAFNSKALVEIPMAVIPDLFGDGISAATRTAVVDAVERDIVDMAERDETLANSGLAATALAMAYELENPFNSATSKSMCARALLEISDRLRELLPPEAEGDAVDDLAARRTERAKGIAAS